MLGSAAVAEVQQILGWRNDKMNEILLALQYAQNEREKPGTTYPWWLDTTATITTVANTSAYNLPTSFIQERETDDGDLFYSNSTRSPTVFLTKLSYKVAQEHYFGILSADDTTNGFTSTSQAVAPGLPRDYVLTPSGVILYPTPDRVLTIYWNYWGHDAVIGLVTTNGWLTNAPWVLIGDTAKKLGADLGNQQAVATAKEVLAVAESNMFRSVIHRHEMSRKRRMGSRL